MLFLKYITTGFLNAMVNVLFTTTFGRLWTVFDFLLYITFSGVSRGFPKNCRRVESIFQNSTMGGFRWLFWGWFPFSQHSNGIFSSISKLLHSKGSKEKIKSKLANGMNWNELKQYGKPLYVGICFFFLFCGQLLQFVFIWYLFI